MANKQIYQLGAKEPSLTDVIPVQDVAGYEGAKKTSIQDIANVIRPYSTYVAILTQSGTDAPIATILENTIGNITWTYNGVGEYYGALSSGTFDTQRSFFNSNLNYYGQPFYSYLNTLQGDNTKLILGTFTAGGNVELNGEIYIEIRVYNGIPSNDFLANVIPNSDLSYSQTI
jgi:hypothetical protein